MTTTGTITLESVTKHFPGGVVAVDDLSLEVQPGEFMVLVGPSGCGKTTALRMVAGLEPVTEGQIRINDKVVTRLPPRDRDIAMVFQNYALYPTMSVEENLGFGLKLRRALGAGHAVHDALADPEGPLADLLEAGDHPQRGRLAAGGGSDEDHELAVSDLEVHAVDSAGPVGEDLAHTVQRHLGHLDPPRSAPPCRAHILRRRCLNSSACSGRAVAALRSPARPRRRGALGPW